MSIKLSVCEMKSMKNIIMFGSSIHKLLKISANKFNFQIKLDFLKNNEVLIYVLI